MNTCLLLFILSFNQVLSELAFGTTFEDIKIPSLSTIGGEDLGSVLDGVKTDMGSLLDGVKTTTGLDMGSLLDGVKTGLDGIKTETGIDMGSLLEGVKNATEEALKGTTDLMKLVGDLQKKILEESGLADYDLDTEKYTELMNYIQQRYSEGASIDIITKEIRQKMRGLIRESMKETMKTMKEDIRTLVHTDRAEPIGKEEVKTYIEGVRESFDKMGFFAAETKEERQESIGDLKESLRMISSLVLAKDETAAFETKTDNFTYHSTFVDGGRKRKFEAQATSVELPAFDFKNQTLTVVEWTFNPYESVSNQELLSTIVSIMLSDYESGNETRVYDLEIPINITLPVNVAGGDVKPICMYWDEKKSDWATDGCVVKSADGIEVECSCSHLTDFSIGQAPAPAPAPAQAQAEQNQYQSTDYRKLYNGIGIGGGVLGAIAFITLIIYKMYNKKKPEEGVGKAQAPTAPVQENPIRSIV